MFLKKNELSYRFIKLSDFHYDTHCTFRSGGTVTYLTPEPYTYYLCFERRRICTVYLFKYYYLCRRNFIK